MKWENWHVWLTIEEAGDGWAVDTEGCCNWLIVILFISNTALLTKSKNTVRHIMLLQPKQQTQKFGDGKRWEKMGHSCWIRYHYIPTKRINRVCVNDDSAVSCGKGNCICTTNHWHEVISCHAPRHSNIILTHTKFWPTLNKMPDYVS